MESASRMALTAVFDAMSRSGEATVRDAIKAIESSGSAIESLKAARRIAEAIKSEPVLKGEGKWKYADQTEPKVLYRSVSPEEWDQIQKDGEIRGGLNTFNGFDPRREVFFGDTLNAELIGQGEDVTRRAEYAAQQTQLQKDYKRAATELRGVEGRIRDRVKELGFNSLDDMLPVLRRRDKELPRLLKERESLEGDVSSIEKSAREWMSAKMKELREADEKRGYSSVVLETKPITGGRVYSKRYAAVGMDQDEYGFDSGAVKLSDIARVRKVFKKQFVD